MLQLLKLIRFITLKLVLLLNANAATSYKLLQSELITLRCNCLLTLLS